MTPEEKAKELIEKFSGWSQNKEYDVKIAKACALICAEEILTELEETGQRISHNPYSKEVINDVHHYWNQVKQFLKQ